MSKRRVKVKAKAYIIKTGDGKLIDLNEGILSISDKLDKMFKETDEVYFENASENSVNKVLEFYEAYNRFTVKQKKKWDDPILFVEKMGKSSQSDSDKKLVEQYKIYQAMEAREFFELMKAAHDMGVIVLVKVLAFVVTAKLMKHTTDDIERQFVNSKF